MPAAPPKPASALRRSAKVSRQLTPQKLGVAWEKVRRVVRDFCRQRGPECRLCQAYANEIEFQLSAEYQLITLDREDNRIVARIGDKSWTIRIVRIKTGGSAYEFRRQRVSATRLMIELLNRALIEGSRNTNGLP